MATIPTNSTPLKFDGLPGFNPFYTPREMLQLGVFDGAFFKKITTMRDIPTEELFKDIPYEKYAQILIPKDDDEAPILGEVTTVNYFGRVVPRRNRCHNMGPNEKILDLDWFSWYCKFYYGRRSIADAGRMRQFRDEVVTLFHYIKNGVSNNPVQPVGYDKKTDLTQFKEWRQQLLHFGWDPTVDPAIHGIYH